MKAVQDTDRVDTEVAEHITSLWNDPQISQLLITKGDSLHIPGGVDGLTHHISRMNEYLSPTFTPTDADLVRVRIKTTGIIETSFTHEGITFTVCDVGGQRSERRKWIQCFSKVDAIIYLVATNEYDTSLEESTGYNSIADSLQQFKVISELQIFQNVPFIVFFNKFDLFTKKVVRVPLSTVFRDYKEFADTCEGTDVEKGIAYFQRNYTQNFGGNSLFTYTTCALDQDNCGKVFRSIREVIIEEALALSGLT
eukprot:TRINITY_DN1550_c0_g1_i5.p1 TRINITY_DN1550_c0_g1~~TRINITY_DN1550_c0_g1_i5.p1  ORF type:complete len:253 (-),score=26.85 TRINITY_DN1550_c0_g1_i5:156-914(-)